MARWIPKAQIAFANDLITASLVFDESSQTRSAIQGIANKLISAALAADPGLAGQVLQVASQKVDQAIATQRIVRGRDVAGQVQGDDSVLGQTTKSGRLLIGWSRNGDLSTWTRAFFRRQVAGLREVPKIPGVFYVERTARSGRATRIIYDDGRQELPGLIVAGGSAGGAALIPDTVNGTTYLTDVGTGIRSRLVPTDRTRIVINGTSTFARSASQFATWASAHGASVVNTANAGVGAEHTLAKLGSRPLLTSGETTIAAVGSTSVVSSNVPSVIYNIWTVSGYFEGHPNAHGLISKPSNGGAPSWTFTRDSAGEAFTIPSGTKFIPDAVSYRDAIFLINACKNNLSGNVDGITTDVAQLVQWTNDAYAYVTSTGKTVAIVGHFQDTGTPADSAARGRIKAYNDAMRLRYGARFIDMGAYVGSTRIFADLGLTPTSADLAEIALGNKAPQISSLTDQGAVDPLHLTVAAAGAVIDYLIGRHLTVTLNWMQEAS